MSSFFRFFSVIFCPVFLLISAKNLEINPSTEIHDVDEVAGKSGRVLTCLEPSGISGTAKRHWWKNGRKFVLDPDDLVISDPDTKKQMPRVGISPAGVEFLVLRPDDSGVFDCVLTDQVILTRYRLTVRDVPFAPGMPVAGKISSRNVTLSWDAAITQNSPVLHYLVFVDSPSSRHDVFPDDLAGSHGEGSHGDRSDEQRTRPRRIRTPDNSTTFTVTNLFPFTSYTFHLIAVSAVGNSRPSAVSPVIQTLTEPPSSAPVLIMANSTSGTTIRLQWLPPQQQDWHGAELSGYRLFYRRAGREETDEILLEKPQAQTYTIQGLLPGWRYYISVQAFNADGYSPAHTEVVSTQETEPSAPRSLLTKGVSNTTVSLAWLAPVHLNGNLLGYKIHYTHPAGFTDTKTFPRYTVQSVDHEYNQGEEGRNWIHYQLTELQPFTTYRIRVTAFNVKGEGPYSAAVLDVTTDVTLPGPPQIVNVTRIAHNAVLVEWTAPREYSRQLDYYYVTYSAASVRGEVVSTQQLLYLPTSPAKTRALEDEYGRFPVEQAILTNLSADHVYHVQVSAATRSIVDTDRLFRGGPSLTYSVPMDAHTTDSTAQEAVLLANPLNMVEMIVIVVVVLLVGLMAVIFGVFCALRKRYTLGTYTYLSPNSPKFDEKSPTFARSPTLDDTHLSSSLLSTHIKKLYADGQIGLTKEFESIATLLQTTDFPGSVKEGQKVENRVRNRYVNVLPYDHSRVKLKHGWDGEEDQGKVDGETGEECGCNPRSAGLKSPGYDYINANFVDGFTSPAAYILTQAPLSNTIVDFWSMVWDYKVRVIIMLTNLVENGRVKCELYWPTGEETLRRYGPYTVTLTAESVTAFYTVRTFTVNMSDAGNGSLATKGDDGEKGEVRQVVQFLYSDWPDHGRPDVTVPLLRFIMKSSRAFEEESSGSPIIHCSAGVGRSGCYIALHSMMLQLDRTGHVDVFQYLLSSRKQRMGLCQNESQYALIYDALLEYVQSDQTEVYLATMDEYVDGLLKDGARGMRQQHSLIAVLDSQTAGGATVEYAKEPCNKGKNRSMAVLPADSHRVPITMQPGVFGSDYVNASFLPSYRHLQQFLVTQYPLPGTVAAFWQMIWDYRVQHVILLNPHQIDPEPAPFYPAAPISDPQVYNTFQVAFHDSQPDNGSFCTFSSTLSSLAQPDDKTTFLCQIIRVSRDFSVSSRCQTLLELARHWESGKSLEEGDLSLGGKKSTGFGGIDRLVVMDELGGPEAVLVCGLLALRQQGLAEASVDVYQTARLYSQARPGVFSSLDTYKEFYGAARGLCQHLAQHLPLEQVCVAGSSLHPSSPTHMLSASKRLSAILEQEEHSIS